MPALKTGPLTRAEIQSVWEGSVDKAYRDPFVAAGEGRGFEVWTQYFAQLERASKAIDVTTQAMFISPWSGQTNPPAAGARKATVTLSIARTKLVERLLVLGAGLVYVGEQTTDSGEDGGVTVVTGRRYTLLQDLVFQPGEQGPFDVQAEAELPGYGFNNPLPATIKFFSQPGTAFTNDEATVVTSPRPASATLPYSFARVVGSVRPDMFVPEHAGQYVEFTAGTNAGIVARMANFVAPVPGVTGSAIGLELHASVRLSSIVGTFQPGEIISFGTPAFGRILAVSSTTKRMAFLLLDGAMPAVGAVATGTVSGATATVASVLASTGLVAEAGTAAWKVLDWASDWGLTSTNVASPAGGLSPMLDELGGERGIDRSPGESDDSYRARVREIADVVTPNAIRRTLNRSFPGHAWSLLEAGSVGLPGFFFDGTNEGPSATPGRASCDAYDVDVIVFEGTLTGTFDFQEPVVFEDAASYAQYATGFAGTVAADALTLVRYVGGLPATGIELAASRVRGLHSGATFVPSAGHTYASTGARRRRTWLDYEQFRGFFVVELEQLGTGEFGFAYDVLGASPYDANPPHGVAFDGYPVTAASLYRQVYAAVDHVRAGGVSFELELPEPAIGDEDLNTFLDLSTLDLTLFLPPESLAISHPVAGQTTVQWVSQASAGTSGDGREAFIAGSGVAFITDGPTVGGKPTLFINKPVNNLVHVYTNSGHGTTIKDTDVVTTTKCWMSAIVNIRALAGAAGTFADPQVMGIVQPRIAMLVGGATNDQAEASAAFVTIAHAGLSTLQWISIQLRFDSVGTGKIEIRFNDGTWDKVNRSALAFFGEDFVIGAGGQGPSMNGWYAHLVASKQWFDDATSDKIYESIRGNYPAFGLP